MEVPKFIQNIILKKEQKVIQRWYGSTVFSNYMEDKMHFAKLIFLNICDLLTDLTNDVTFTTQNTLKENTQLFGEFVAFFNDKGKFVLDKLFVSGFVVIAHNDFGFRVLFEDEYLIIGDNQNKLVQPKDNTLQVYVMRSETFQLTGESDYLILKPFLTLLDNVLNSSNTITARLGALIVSSPQQTSLPAPETLTEKDKEDMEKQTSENYGSLRNQKQFLIFPRPMNTQVISLSNIDNRMIDKVKTCVLAIADRIKVPANQISMVDALSSKSFANGSEMREGDFNKYQSFERLLNNTFVNMATSLGLKVDYEIYNKPTRQVPNSTITEPL